MKDFEFPFAIDKVNKKPSVTLFFAYVSFMLAIVIVAYLTYRDVLAGSVAALMLFFGSLLMYRLRQVDKFKISLKEQSIEVEDIK